jgi:hypothetical protein
MYEVRPDFNVPDKSLEGAIGLLTSLKVNPQIKSLHDRWVVMGGDKPLLVSDTKEAAETFVFGMALAYSTLPGPILERLRKFLSQLGKPTGEIEL